MTIKWRVCVCGGYCHTRFWQRDDEGPLQLEPIILSAAHGLQLVGVQLCSAPAQVNQFCPPSNNSPVCSVAALHGALISRRWQWQCPPPPTPPSDTVTVRVIRVAEVIFFSYIRQMTAPVEGLAPVKPG